MPGMHLACSCEVALCLAGTVAGLVLPPGHGRPPLPSGPPSGLSTPVPAASTAPLPAVSPLRPLPEAPGSLTIPGEREDKSTEVTILRSFCLLTHLFSQETFIEGWGYSSVVEHLPSKCEALGLILSTT